MQNTKQNHLRCFVTSYLSVVIFHLSDVNEGVPHPGIICHHRQSLVPNPKNGSNKHDQPVVTVLPHKWNPKTTNPPVPTRAACRGAFRSPLRPGWQIRWAQKIQKQWNPAGSMILSAFHEPQLIHPCSSWAILHPENPAKLQRSRRRVVYDTGTRMHRPVLICLLIKKLRHTVLCTWMFSRSGVSTTTCYQNIASMLRAGREEDCARRPSKKAWRYRTHTVVLVLIITITITTIITPTPTTTFWNCFTLNVSSAFVHNGLFGWSVTHLWPICDPSHLYRTFEQWKPVLTSFPSKSPALVRSGASCRIGKRRLSWAYWHTAIEYIYIILYYTILYYIILYYIMLYYVILCYTMLYYVYIYIYIYQREREREQCEESYTRQKLANIIAKWSCLCVVLDYNTSLCSSNPSHGNSM